MKIRSLISRFSTLLLAGGVAVVALNIGLHATQTITTPNASKVAYNLAAGHLQCGRESSRERSCAGDGRAE